MTTMSTDLRLLKLDILSYWHPGTGKGGGPNADALVNVGQNGLPMLPGRTVRGLLRAAARAGVAAGVLSLDDELRWFGSRLAGDTHLTADNRVGRLEAARYSTTEGLLRVETATLGETEALRAQWSRLGQAAKAENAEATAALSVLKRSLSTTKLTDQGIASDETLRTIEIYVPMALYAPLHLPGATAATWQALDLVARLFLRGVGSHRHRGLGRCDALIITTPDPQDVPHA